ncbi:hypothetical protein GMAR_ORF8 [Golden Marseillevirus]|uniref:hypothetical protein n=1 Tax=Golden Marseillevirus TaxID=1720526 RepID=UPI000877A881|nr:hypothetical protein GMAR_ORF8 [Golden Marseillevirus]ALX27383.1 hypothetical protein GMAR_ORF8 [Golden Marseillevirus]
MSMTLMSPSVKMEIIVQGHNKILKMERINQLIQSKEFCSRELFELLTPGHTVLIDEDEVLVLGIYDETLFGMSKSCGGMMSFSLSDVQEVLRYSEEANQLYSRLYNLC